MTDRYILQWGDENVNVYDLEPLISTACMNSIRLFGIGLVDALVFSREFLVEFFMPQSQLEASYEQGYDFFMDKEKLDLFIDTTERTMADVKDNVVKLAQTDLTRLTDEEFLQLEQLFIPSYIDLFTCYNLTNPHNTEKIAEELNKTIINLGVDDPEHLVGELTKHDVRIEILSEDNPLTRTLSESIKDEGADIDKSLAEVEVYNEVPADTTEKKKLLSGLDLSEKTLYQIDLVGKLAYLRLKMRFAGMKAMYFYELFIVEYSRRSGLAKSVLRRYYGNELAVLVKDGVMVGEEVLALRDQGVVVVLEDGEVRTIEGPEAVKMRDKLIVAPNTDELKGKVTCRGHAVGKVISLSYAESESHAAKIAEMDAGDIIVTDMTRPNMISACKKAGAIVTDEGGLLCHAAIISREFNVPCIIGTQDGTRVFKHGDYVEVDAEKGIVRKLSDDERKKAEFDAKSRTTKT